MSKQSWFLAGALALGSIAVVVPMSHVAVAADPPAPFAAYDSIDAPMPGNVPSLGYEATSTSEFGDLVQLAPGPRALDSVTVMLSSWGCETGSGTTCSTGEGATFDHDLTLHLYQYDPSPGGTGVGAEILQRTDNFAIPYRPSADPDCAGGRWQATDGGTCYSGFATPVTFDFDGTVNLPANLIWTVSYNTSHRGYAPIGESAPCYTDGNGCGYDSLNVGLSGLGAPSAGTDLDHDDTILNSTWDGAYCAPPAGTLRIDAGCWTGYRPMATISTIATSEIETTEVVKAANTTWRFFDDNNLFGAVTGSYVVGPDTAPIGNGSAQLTVNSTSQGQAFAKSMLGGTRLDRITDLEYSSNQTAGPLAPALQFPVRYAGTAGAYQGRLVYEPIYTLGVGPVPAGWQHWDTLAGRWWATGNTPGSAICNTSIPCTWAQIIQNFPNAVINPGQGSMIFKVGSGVASFTGQVDAFTVGVDDGTGNISTTTYDFEPTTQCSTDCYVDANSGNDLNGGTSASDAKKTIQAGVNQVDTNGTVHVAAGTYAEDVVISDTISLLGAGIDSAIVRGPTVGGTSATITVGAPDVHISGFTVTRQGNATGTWNLSTLNSAGIAIQGLTNSATISGVKLLGNRTAIDINNSNGNTIVDSFIEDNRTGIILRNQTDDTTVTGNVIADNWTVGVLFLDASGGTNVPVQSAANSTFRGNSISGNWYGGVVDRQTGGSLPAPGDNAKNFSGNWWGTTTPVVTTDNSAEPGYAAQIPAPIGTATNPGGAPDIAGPASANLDFTPLLESGTDTDAGTIGFQGSTAAITVHADGAQTGTGSRLQEGVDTVDAGGEVHVRAGSYVEPVPANITKSLSLLGPNAGISPNDSTDPLDPNAARVAEATISPAAGDVALRVGASGVTIDGFTFTDAGTAGSSTTTIIGAGGNFGGLANDFAVLNNVFDGITRTAVYTNGPATMTGVTVDDNRVADATRADGCGTGPVAAGNCGRQLFNLWQADDVSFSGNVVFAAAGNGDRTRVVQVTFPNSPSLHTGTGDNIVIRGNTIRNACVYTCISLAAGADDVAIVGNDVDVDAGNIVQLYTNWTGGRVQIDHNAFHAANGAALIVEATAADLSEVTVTRNAILGGVANPLAATLGAPCNWWGQPSGALVAQLIGHASGINPLGSTDLDGTCQVPAAPTTAAPTPTTTAPPASIPPTGLATPDFTPVTPTRVFDTRTGTPDHLRVVTKAPIGPGQPLEVKLTDLGGLVPAKGVGAVSINVTSTRSQGDGYVSVGPCGSTNLSSSVNFQAGSDRANAVVTPVSADGTVCIASSVATDVVVDVNGWFTDVPGLHTLTPTRVFDTRTGTAGLRTVAKTPLQPGVRLEVKLADLPGGLVPATGVGSVSLNVTSTRSVGDGFVTVSPCTTDDAVSNLNFQGGDDAANLVLTPVSASGTVCFTASAATDLVVDINGWLGTPSGFTAVNPARVADTRTGAGLVSVPVGALVPGATLQVKLTDLPGGLVPATGVGAVALNVTSTRAASDGYLTVSPCGAANDVSNVNFQAGRDRANAVLTPVSAAGTVCITASQPTDVVIDVTGWFSDHPAG